MGQSTHWPTATEIATAVREGRLGPDEVVAAALERIAATEPDLHAWELVDARGALAAAKRLVGAPHSDPAPLLLGVPVGVKDVFDVRGLPTGAGFAPYRERVAREDAAAVRALRRAGAIIIGKTATAQFAWAPDPPLTANPRDRTRTPGGSSSGSAAAVGAGHVPLALGTQTGGSLLRPAAYCGIVGWKPTFGRVSRVGVYPLNPSLDHVGVVTRSVADAALWLQASAAHDPDDPASVRCAAEDFVGAAGIARSTPRLGVVRELTDAAEGPVRHAVERAVDHLARAGAEIVDVRLPVSLEQVLALFMVINLGEGASVHAASYARFPEHYGPRNRTSAEVAALVPAAAYLQALRLRRIIRPRVLAMLGGIDAVVCPTVRDVPPARGAGMGDPSFQTLWNVFGLPQLTMPTSAGAAGELRPGLQLVGPPFGDALVLSVSRFAELALGLDPASLRRSRRAEAGEV